MQPFSLSPLPLSFPQAGLGAACAIVWLGTALTVTAQDWPQFRGPDGMGRTAVTDLPLTWSGTDNVVWRTELPGPGGSTPATRGNRIYLTCYTGYGPATREQGALQDLKRHLLCLDASDGKILWSTEDAAAMPEQERIREEHGYSSSAPTVDDQRVYVFYGKSGAQAYDLSGQKLWATDVGSGLNGWGSATSPVLHGDLVIINASVESESLVALNRATGQEVWRAGGIKESWNTPVLVQTASGETELVLGIFGGVLGFDPRTGERLWHCDNDIKWYICPSVVAHEGVVYSIGGRTGGMIAVRSGGRGDVTASHRLWKLNKGSNVSSPVYHDGHLYFAHENLGIAYAVNVASGELVYEERMQPSPGQIYASALLAGDRVYYVSRDGRTAVVAAEPTYRQLAMNVLPRSSGTFNASPAVTDNRLLIRSDRFLYCLGTK